MKKILLIGGAAVIIIVVVIYFVFTSLDTITKAAVEKYSSEITQTDVRLSGVEISASEGKAGLFGFSVGNPKTFKTPTAFQLGEASLDLDLGSLRKDVIRIRRIVIGSPRVTYEIAKGGSNVDAIQCNVGAYLGPKKMEGARREEPKGDAKAGPKLIVESSLFRNGRVDLNAEKLAGQKMTIPLPDIHLRDLGKAKGDVTPAELTNEILAAVRKAAVKAIREKGLDQALGQVKGKALKRGREILKKAMGGEQKGAVGSLKKGAAEAGKALKNLLGN